MNSMINLEVDRIINEYQKGQTFAKDVSMNQDMSVLKNDLLKNFDKK